MKDWRFVISAIAMLAPTALLAQGQIDSATTTDSVATKHSATTSLGEYLATAGNCVSCHTRDGGEPFAGGHAFVTPFGTVYSTNITPDQQTGIGNWSEQQFADAMRLGIRADGEHLYPVFPYASFTKLSDEDIAALFAYLTSRPPVSEPARPNELRFPYNQRWALGIWKWLYFKEARFEPQGDQSAQWNRGKYLVEGLGHCGACHTPRNFLGAERTELAMSGATYQDEVAGRLLDWSASNLTSAPNGLAAWSMADIASYLRLGFNARAGVFGPMNEVIVNSTRHWSEDDVEAVAAYLKSLPAKDHGDAVTASEKMLQAGSLQYDIHCGTCHLPTGLGSSDTGPPLVGSAVALAADPASLINIVLYGAQRPAVAPSQQWHQRSWKKMDPFAEKLGDEEAAALLTYVRSAWGNQGSAVNAEQVGRQRK